jgi:hypothetical protein
MNFFLPAAQDAAQAERVYEGIRKSVQSQIPYPLTDRRIYSIRHRHDGKLYEATVGEVFGRVGEIVIAIIESTHLYYVCTENRGVARGEPYLVGRNEVISIEDFEQLGK